MSKSKKQGHTPEELLEATHKSALGLRIEIQMLDDAFEGVPPSEDKDAVMRWVADMRHVVDELYRAAEKLEEAIEEKKIRREADEYVATARR